MNQTTTPGAARSAILWNRLRTFLSKPHNVILLLMGIVVTITTIAPIVAIVEDTFKIHPGTIDAHLTGQTAGYTLVNYIDLFTNGDFGEALWHTVYFTIGTVPPGDHSGHSGGCASKPENPGTEFVQDRFFHSGYCLLHLHCHGVAVAV